MKRYLAFDIGCIECGELSDVVGFYLTWDEAQVALDAYREAADWGGQHSLEIFEVDL